MRCDIRHFVQLHVYQLIHLTELLIEHGSNLRSAVSVSAWGVRRGSQGPKEACSRPGAIHLRLQDQSPVSDAFDLDRISARKALDFDGALMELHAVFVAKLFLDDPELTLGHLPGHLWYQPRVDLQRGCGTTEASFGQLQEREVDLDTADLVTWELVSTVSSSDRRLKYRELDPTVSMSAGHLHSFPISLVQYPISDD